MSAITFFRSPLLDASSDIELLQRLSSFWHDPEEDNRYRTVEINLNHPIKLARIGMRNLISEDRKGVILPIASVGGIAGTYHCPL